MPERASGVCGAAAVLLLMLLGLSSLGAQAGVVGQGEWPAPGRFAVGFRGLELRDVARRSPADPSRRYPVVAAVWYPARAGSGSPLRLLDYLRYRASRDRLSLPTAAADEEGEASLRRAVAFVTGADSVAGIREIAARPVGARERADPLPGPFPVLIGGLGGPEQNGLLAEWLASHGWVVLAASSPALLATAEVTEPELALEHRVRTLELLLRHAAGMEVVDIERLAVVGVNFDGMAALAFQMRTGAGSAVVSIDGWEGKRDTRRALLAGPWLNPSALTVPYLLLLQDEEAPPPSLTLDFELFDAFRFSERRALSYSGLSHVPLIVQNLVAVDAVRQPAHGHLWRTVRAFIEAGLAGDGPGDPRGGPALALFRRSSAAPSPPSPLRLEWLLRNGQAGQALVAYRDALPHLGGIRLMAPGTLQRHVRRLFQAGDTANATALARIAVQAYPTEAAAWHTLGDLHRAAGDAREAARAYRAALNRLDPDAVEARRVLEQKLAETMREERPFTPR